MTLAQFLKAKKMPAIDLAEKMLARMGPRKLLDVWRIQRGVQRWAYEGVEPTLANAILLVAITGGDVGLWELMPSRPPPGDLPQTLPLVGAPPPVDRVG